MLLCWIILDTSVCIIKVPYYSSTIASVSVTVWDLKLEILIIVGGIKCWAKVMCDVMLLRFAAFPIRKVPRALWANSGPYNDHNLIDSTKISYNSTSGRTWCDLSQAGSVPNIILCDTFYPTMTMASYIYYTMMIHIRYTYLRWYTQSVRIKPKKTYCERWKPLTLGYPSTKGTNHSPSLRVAYHTPHMMILTRLEGRGTHMDR